MKGMTTCKICGRDFPLIAEEHYIARDPQKIGVLANLANTDKAMEYDAFDCPHCGCQNIMQNRKPLWIPEVCKCTEEDEEETDSESEVSEENPEETPDHDGCVGCKYEAYTCLQEPCYSCKYNYVDHYEKKEAENE